MLLDVREHNRIFRGRSTQTRMKRTLIAGMLALLLGLPLGWLSAMLLTPVLWRLEPVLHMELAGHSGPADWIFHLVGGIVTSGLFLFFRFVVLKWRRETPSR
jgi:ABC-type antimicrobial peptide transport system permease subunit